MKDRHTRASKFLSLVLRHQPGKVGLTLDREGWVSVSRLLQALAAHGLHLTTDELQEIVRANDKQRFSLSPDGLLIRANQGHSVEVELGYEPTQPPPVLYHGTAERFLASIKRQGLLRGQRHHVHLSEREETATEVGRRYGRPVLLRIASGEMHADGHLFFRSANGVWLTEHVPTRYIAFQGGDDDDNDPR
jgi:putative RNA 2'-phosphotransferase